MLVSSDTTHPSGSIPLINLAQASSRRRPNAPASASGSRRWGGREMTGKRRTRPPGSSGSSSTRPFPGVAATCLSSGPWVRLTISVTEGCGRGSKTEGRKRRDSVFELQDAQSFGSAIGRLEAADLSLCGSDPLLCVELRAVNLQIGISTSFCGLLRSMRLCSFA